MNVQSLKYWEEKRGLVLKKKKGSCAAGSQITDTRTHGRTGTFRNRKKKSDKIRKLIATFFGL